MFLEWQECYIEKRNRKTPDYMCLVKRIKNCVCTLLRLIQLFLHRRVQEKAEVETEVKNSESHHSCFSHRITFYT